MVGYSPEIPAEPDGGEVAPAQLPYHVIPPVEQVANLHHMVAACSRRY
jgi:hypothetical protein